MLENAVDALKKCSKLAKQNKIKIEFADTHMINIKCSEKIGDELEQSLLGVNKREEEEESDEKLPEYDPEDDPDFL